MAAAGALIVQETDSRIVNQLRKSFERLDSPAEASLRARVADIVAGLISAWGEVPLIAVNMKVIPRFTALKVLFTAINFTGITIFTSVTKLELLRDFRRYLRDPEIKALETTISLWERAAIMTGSVVAGVLTVFPLALVAIHYNPDDISAPLAIIASDGLVTAYSSYLGAIRYLSNRQSSIPFSRELHLSKRMMIDRANHHLDLFSLDPTTREGILEWWIAMNQSDTPSVRTEKFLRKLLAPPSSGDVMEVSTRRSMGKKVIRANGLHCAGAFAAFFGVVTYLELQDALPLPAIVSIAVIAGLLNFPLAIEGVDNAACRLYKALFNGKSRVQINLFQQLRPTAYKTVKVIENIILTTMFGIPYQTSKDLIPNQASRWYFTIFASAAMTALVSFTMELSRSKIFQWALSNWGTNEEKDTVQFI